MPHLTPIESKGGLDMYEKPVKGKTYVCTVDVARGTTNDYSAFVMLDCSQVPYRVVAKYRNNEIKPFVFPNIIHQVCTYNTTHVLVEE